jgi:formylmethanofuran dehydrogenase subunit C
MEVVLQIVYPALPTIHWKTNMPLILQLNCETNIPIQVDGIHPGAVRGMSVVDVAKLIVWFGKDRIALGELFDIRGTVDETMNWQGNLRSVHWIGTRMTGGTIILQGDVGRHLGSQMQGGEIVVHGDAGDFVGCEMTGGSIRIEGNAQHWVGAAYPGTKAGMKGGTIFVHGNAGNAVGHAIRRGIIGVRGSAGDLVGWNMLAGTIIAGGAIGKQTGLGMVRGTIVLASEQSPNGDQLLMPIFKRSGSFRPTILRMLCQSINRTRESVPIPQCAFDLYHGDLLKGGRGEVFIAGA